MRIHEGPEKSEEESKRGGTREPLLPPGRPPQAHGPAAYPAFRKSAEHDGGYGSSIFRNLRERTADAKRSLLRLPAWLHRLGYYGLALVLVALGMIVRMELTHLVGPGLPTYITFYPLVMLTSLIGGWGPGLVSILAAAVVADYWLLPPPGLFKIESVVDLVGLAFFCTMGMFVSIVAELYRQMRGHLEDLVLVRTAELNGAYEHLQNQAEELQAKTEELLAQAEGLRIANEELRERDQKLREREERYRRIVETATEGIAMVDAGARIVFVNDRWTEMFGYSRDEALRMTHFDLVFPEDVIRMKDRWESRKCGRGERSEFCFRRKDGRPVWTLVGVTPHFGPDGEFFGTLTMLADITEQKRAEEALRESEEKYRNIVETATEAIVLVDANARIVFVNDRWSEMFGYSREETMHMTHFEVVFPEDMARMKERWESRKRGRKEGYELRLRHKDGSSVWVLVGVAPNFGPAGEFLGTLVMLADITDRKRAEGALRESGEKYRNIVETATEAIVLVDADARIVFVNDHWSEMFGYSREEALHMTHFDLLFPEDMARQKERWESRQGGRKESYVARLRRKDGSPVRVLVGVAPNFGPEGEFLGSLNMLADITERWKLQEALRKSEERFRKKAEATLREQADLLDLTHDTVFATDVEGVIKYWNRSAEQRYGWPAEQAVGKVVHDMLKTVFPAPLEQIKAEVMRTGRWEGELVHVKRDGSQVVAASRWALQRDERGAPVAILETDNDITERKKAEEELSANLHYFESMDRINRAMQGTDDLEQMMSDVLDAVLTVFGCDGAFLTYPCDPEAATWFAPMERCRPAAYPGVHDLNLRVPTDPDVAEHFRILLASNTPVQFGPHAPRPIPKDMSERFACKCVMSMALHPTEGAAWEFGIHQCSDARAWTQKEEELYREIGRRLADMLSMFLASRKLQDSERHVRTLLENLPDCIARFDKEGRHVIVNSAVVDVLGIPPERFIGKTLLELGGPGLGAQNMALEGLIKQAFEEGIPNSAECEWVTIQGNRYFDVRHVPEKDETGNVVTVLRIAHDITERKRAEEEQRAKEAAEAAEKALRELNAILESKVAQRTEELEHRAWQLQKLTLELTEAEERERKRLAEILHDDLQQVLVAANFHAELLCKWIESDVESRKTAGQVRDLLVDAIDKSRSLSHELSSPALSQRDLGGAFEWLARQMKKKHGFTVHMKAGNWIEVASEARRLLLYKAAQELLFNVIKHAGVREATLRLRRRDGRIRLTVSDRGRGFNPADPDHTFGLGLLSIRERVECLGGRLKIRSTPGKGSTFLIALPDGEDSAQACP